MTEIIENRESVKVRNRRVHMANERTFLAWIRTSIGIMVGEEVTISCEVELINISSKA